LLTFDDRLPLKSAIPATIGNIARLAQASGLSIEEADYRPVQESGRPIMRYEMSIQVVDGYAKLKGFMAKLLSEVPNLAIANLTLQRQKVADAKVEAQLRFVMYFRDSDK
jgi:Tfp pilus assembly protein PilO